MTNWLTRAVAVGVGLLLVVATAFVVFFVWVRDAGPALGEVRDEALVAGRESWTFSAAEADRQASTAMRLTAVRLWKRFMRP